MIKSEKSEQKTQSLKKWSGLESRYRRIAKDKKRNSSK